MTLTRQMKWSAIAHSVLFFVIVIKGLVFPDDVPKYIPALRVDVVGLPDILKKDLENVRTKDSAGDASTTESAKPAPEPEPEKPAADEMVLKAKAEAKKKQAEELAKKKEAAKKAAQKKLAEKKAAELRDKKIQSALSRIKALDRVDKIRDSAGSEASDSQPIKGNRLSDGSTLTGDARETSETGYLDSIRELLKTHWELPVWLARQNYSAQVQIFLDVDGRIRRLVFLKPSGNPQFDEAVKAAVKRSEPFPIPPDRYKGTMIVTGLKLGFPL